MSLIVKDYDRITLQGLALAGRPRGSRPETTVSGETTMMYESAAPGTSAISP